MPAFAPPGIPLAVRQGDTGLTSGADEVEPDAVSPVAFGSRTFEVVAESPAPFLALPLTVLMGVLSLSALAAGLLIVLARRDSATRHFLMRITHDLHTPLTAIRGHATALVDGIVPAHEANRSLSVTLTRLAGWRPWSRARLTSRGLTNRFRVDLAPTASAPAYGSGPRRTAAADRGATAWFASSDTTMRAEPEVRVVDRDERDRVMAAAPTDDERLHAHLQCR